MAHQPRRVLPERPLHRLGLQPIVQLGRGPVVVQDLDLIGAHLRVRARQRHRPGALLHIRRGAHAVIRVTGRPVPQHLPHRSRCSLLRKPRPLDHHRPRPLAQDEPVPPRIKRARRGPRRLRVPPEVPRRDHPEQFHRPQGLGLDVRIRPDHHPRVGRPHAPGPQLIERQAHRIAPARAPRRDAQAGPPQPEPDAEFPGQVPVRRVRDRPQAGPVARKLRPVLRPREVDPPAPGPQDQPHPTALRRVLRDLPEPRLPQRLARGAERHGHQPGQLQGLAVPHHRLRVPIPAPRRDARGHPRPLAPARLERAHARPARPPARRERPHADPQGRHRPHPGDDPPPSL